MKTTSRTIYRAFALIAFAFLAFLPPMLAVSPPPDGCYSGLTTAEGCSALFSLTSGTGNTALGHDALFSDTTGSWNTGVGAVALAFNDADFNTAVGVASLLLNTAGTNNSALGAAAMVNNDTGMNNTAVGAFALFSNTGGSNNNALGVYALYHHLSGSYNNGVGSFSLSSNQTGSSNNALGDEALAGNISGSYNTAVGDGALQNLSSGQNNVALGSGAGSNLNSSETGNIDIGKDVAGLAGENNTIRIGDNLPDTAGASFCYVGGIVNQTAPFAMAVYIGPTGKLGTVQSSRRFKQDIKPMDSASEALFSLTPVSFRYKKQIDPTGTSQYGLVAEDVEKVNADLVVRDKEGTTTGVRYDQVNAMLLNEFLKEHKTVQEQGATIARVEKQLETVTATLQKVSAQLELSKSAPQTALNNQ